MDKYKVDAALMRGLTQLERMTVNVFAEDEKKAMKMVEDAIYQVHGKIGNLIIFAHLID